LKDESSIVSLAQQIQKYFIRASDFDSAAKVALLQVEHLYYKHDSIANAVHKSQTFTAAFGALNMLHPASIGVELAKIKGMGYSKVHPASMLGSPSINIVKVDYGDQISNLCKFLYKHGSDRAKTRAMLCQITHHALHDRFDSARDLLLMSHLQDNISMADVETQILYNRMIVTVGLCAFRKGLIAEAHDCLKDVCSSRIKELLAQGIQTSRYQEKNPEQEKAERRRQMPYHMHINLDLLECCHLTLAMLREVPVMASERGDPKKRVISKIFRRHLDNFDHQVFTGPPENIRDHVIAGAKAMMQGDWKRCVNLILSLDVWNLIPGEGQSSKVKIMLKEKMQIEALRTYLFTYSSCYDSLSLPQLCAMFDIPQRKAHSIVSKMLINQEISGAWDQPTNSIILYRVEPTKLQSLALQYAEKAAVLVESNERLLDAKTGNYSHRDDKWSGGGDRASGNRGFKSERWNNVGGSVNRGAFSGNFRSSGRGAGNKSGWIDTGKNKAKAGGTNQRVRSGMQSGGLSRF